MNKIMEINRELKSKQLNYDIWHPKYGIDYLTRTEFTCGGCYALAQQINLITGWPIYAEIEYSGNGEDFIHAWVVNNEGLAVDINGVHESSWAKTKFSGEKPKGKIVKYTSNEPFGYYSQWAKDIINALPEHFGIEDIKIKKDIKDYLKKINELNNKSKKSNQLLIKKIP